MVSDFEHCQKLEVGLVFMCVGNACVFPQILNPSLVLHNVGFYILYVRLPHTFIPNIFHQNQDEYNFRGHYSFCFCPLLKPELELRLCITLLIMLRVAHLHDNASNREHEPHQAPKQRTSDEGSNDAQREIVQWAHSAENQHSVETAT